MLINLKKKERKTFSYSNLAPGFQKSESQGKNIQILTAEPSTPRALLELFGVLSFLSFISKGPLDWTRLFSLPDNRQKSGLAIRGTLCIPSKEKILHLTKQSQSRSQALRRGGRTIENSQGNDSPSMCLLLSVHIKGTEIQTVRKHMQLQNGSLLTLLPVCCERITSLPFASVCFHFSLCLQSFY